MLNDAQTYFSANQVAINNNAGNAYAETTILNMLANNITSSQSGLIGDAYLSTLKRGVPIINGRADAYTFTHSVFFASNFGRQAITGIDTAGYGTLIETQVANYLNDPDVLGELLITACIIGYWSVNLDNALTTFRTAFTTNDRTNFDQCYHLILVGGILGKFKA